MASTSKEATVQECEDYIEQHGIHAILKDAIAKICQERPQNPMKYLRDYFDSLIKVSADSIFPSFMNISVIFIVYRYYTGESFRKGSRYNDGSSIV